MRFPRPARVTAATAAVLLSVGLVACGSEDEAAPTTEPTTTPMATTAVTKTTTSSPTPTTEETSEETTTRTTRAPETTGTTV